VLNLNLYHVRGEGFKRNQIWEYKNNPIVEFNPGARGNQYRASGVFAERSVYTYWALQGGGHSAVRSCQSPGKKNLSFA